MATRSIEHLSPINIQLLTQEVQAAFPEAVFSLEYDGETLYLHTEHDITPQQVDTLRSILSNHDASMSSEAQAKAAKAAAALDELRALFGVSSLRGLTQQEISAAVETQIDSWTTLADAQADLKTWLPILFAGVALSFYERS